MAFDQAGRWKVQNDDVASQVEKVAASDSPLMKQAAGFGMAMANSRGLGNSSIAAGTSQGEVLKVATTIGGQNAQQINSKNLQYMSDQGAMDRTQLQESSATARASLGAESNERIAGMQISSEMARLDKSIAANQKLAELGDKSAMERLQVDVASRAQLQSMSDNAAWGRQIAGDEAAYERQQLQSASGLQQQAMADLTALQRQREDLSARTDIASADRDAELARLDRQIEANRSLATMEADSQWDRATLDATTRLNLGQLEVDQNARNNAISAATNLQNSYLDALSASMSNPDIPANVRAEYQRSLQAATEAALKMVSGISGMNLTWGSLTPPPAPTTGFGNIPGISV